ncbi:MAG: hypothetical protein HFJ36_04630 [Clostridia bacterium]|nr:hypothetical protein [Clostridia bacterium]
MNLIEESFQNREEKKKKKTTKIILIAIVFVVMIIIGITSYLFYIQSTTLKVSINGESNGKIKNLLYFADDGTVYAQIKEIAKYFGYDSYSGGYNEISEEPNKCYVQNENEVANFQLEETKIYKLDLTKNNGDYEYVYTKKPVIARNGVLYASIEGLEKGFNISFDYNQEKNTIDIWTTPALYQYYASRVLDYGYTELNDKFVNQKAILNDKLIVLKDKDKKQYGVIKTDGTILLEPKYDNITYLPHTGDFLVETNKKVGILTAERRTKVQIIYDSIELMDSDSGLYVAKKDNKYGVIDSNGNIKIYIENDEIGMDISKFSQNNIKSKYILVDNIIPARKDKLWGLYDKNGNQLVDYTYDTLGYIASSNKDALNLLVIPNYDVLVAGKNKKYTLVNSSGRQLFDVIADDIYMTISGGERHYYITVNDQIRDAEELLNISGITSKDSEQSNENRNQTNKNNTNSNNENTNINANTNTNTNTDANANGTDDEETNTDDNNNDDNNDNDNENNNNNDDNTDNNNEDNETNEDGEQNRQNNEDEENQENNE